MCMSNITLYVPESVKKRMDSHSDIRWSEVVRQAILKKLEDSRKLRLLRKYVEKEPFTQEDFSWMDEHDWHPVDEKGMKLGFVESLKKARKGKFIRAKSVEELFE
jgi:hypothetical protein